MKRIIINSCIISVIFILIITTVSYAKVSGTLPTCAVMAKYLIDLNSWKSNLNENPCLLQGGTDHHLPLTVNRNYKKGDKTIGVIMYVGWD